jgi:NTE family protein
LRKKYGWYKGVKFEKWLNQLIKQKTGDENIRFADLSVKFKALYITGTSLNDQKAFLFSAESFPEMKVKDAVRISMSIPLYYQAVWMDDAGILYKKPLKNKVLHVMTDGGFLNNFPIEVFDSTKYRETGTKNSFSINPFTVGCRIDSKPQIALDQQPGNTLLAPIAVNSLGNYMKEFMVLNMERLSRQKLKPEDWQRTISIDDGGIGPKIKKMPAEKISLLVQNGFDATIRFLENKQAQSP